MPSLNRQLRNWVKVTIRSVVRKVAGSKSQFLEDFAVSTVVPQGKPGFYVDVGAYHPIIYSNTHMFYRRGWRGLNIEPNPSGFELFQDQRPEDCNLCCVISRSEAEVRFKCDGVYSSIVEAGKGTPEAHVITVSSRSLASVLAEHLPAGREIAFLSVDCEGHDLEVLKSNDWEAYRPLVVVVENHDPAKPNEISRFLEGHEYRFWNRFGLSDIFLQPEVARQARRRPNLLAKLFVWLTKSRE